MAVPQPGSPRLRFELLGPVRAWRDDTEVDLGPAKQRAVLAVLLIHAGKPVATPRVIDAVWQDRPPKNGPNVVQKYVAGLRRALDPSRSPRSPGAVLGWSDAGYVLNVERGGVDVDEFGRLVREAGALRGCGRLDDAATALRRALDLWHAEPLAGLSGPLFDSTRERLDGDRADAYEQWAEVELALGRHATVAPELARAVADRPLRERLRYLQVLALYRDGRQAEALAAYHDAARYLDDELGVEPGERLKALHLAILRGQPAPGEKEPEPVPTPAVPATGTAPGTVPAGPTPEPVSRAGSGAAGIPTTVGYDAPPSAFAAPPPYPPWVGYGPTTPRWRRALARTLAAAVPLVTFGLASWIVVAYLAIRRRSLLHGAAAVGYLVLVVLLFAAIGHSPPDAPLDTLDVIGIVSLFVAWMGGSVHAGLIAVAEHDPRRSP